MLNQRYTYNLKTNGELSYCKTISKFELDRFLTFILVRCHVTFKVTVLHLRHIDRYFRI